MSHNDMLNYSVSVVDDLIKFLKSKIKNDAISIILGGSFARKEASTQSDLDYFIVHSNDLSQKEESNILSIIDSKIKNIGIRQPSNDGAFSKFIKYDAFKQNIGGNDDDNKHMTQRILLILESRCLYGDKIYNDLLNSIVNKYIDASISDNNITQFLLNDIIRYWRTVTVDYVYKISESNPPKPWAIRNIKLTFSRKLLYASGVFSVGHTAYKTYIEKQGFVKKMIALTPIDRLEHCSSSAHVKDAINLYKYFLEKISCETNRKILEDFSNEYDREKLSSHLDKLRTDERYLLYRDLKNKGHEFTGHILAAFKDTFPSTHPIHKAILF